MKSLGIKMFSFSVEKLCFNFKIKTSHYCLMPMDNDKFKTAMVNVALNRILFSIQMGCDSSPLRFTKMIIWSYEIYSVNRFMITKTLDELNIAPILQ